MAPLPPHLARFALTQRLTGWARITPATCDCRCPAHEDSQASLSVSIGNSGALLLRCHAGCDTAAILASLGAGYVDLYPPEQQKFRHNGIPHGSNGIARSNEDARAIAATRGVTTDMHQPAAPPSPARPAATATAPATAAPAIARPPRKWVASYEYLDAVGRHVQQVTRWEPKAFSQRYRAPTGEWVYKAPPEARRALYHLDRIAANPSLPVFLCEGEKDVDQLQKGLQINGQLTGVATTAPGGAAAGKSTRKWLPQFTESLRGRNVFILPDSDAPGREHAQNVAAALHGVAALVAIVDLPLPPTIDPARKWDVSDWINAGGTCVQFTEAVVAAQSRPWQPPEGTLGNGSPAAPGPAQPPAKLPITNVDSTAAGDIPVPVDGICSRVLEQCGNWPRRVGNTLFAHDSDAPGRPVWWLERNPQLWAYVGSKASPPPHFTREPGAHTKEEVFYRLCQTVQAYEQVETLPHHPRIANHYYADPVLPESTGEHLDRLLDFFCPETDADRAIMRTAIVTPFWGGPPGQRPMFVVTSDAGRGAGKSTIAQVCERLAGGMLSINPLEDISRVKNRLLSPEGLLRRVAVLDNVKSMRFSWGDLEGLVTSTTVSGHRLHHGEASRPNLFTWYMTMNGLDLSTDMAKRCVILKIRKPAWRGDWLEELLKFIDTNRLSIISDCIAHLSGERTALGKSTRWGLWEKYVLGLEHDSEKILSLIISRQESADVEDEESQTLEAHIAAELDKMNMHSETMKCYISLRAMHMWFREALRDKSRTVMETARIVRQKIAEGGCRRLSNSTSHRHGRGFVWTGEACFANQEVWGNLDESLETRGKNSFEPF